MSLCSKSRNGVWEVVLATWLVKGDTMLFTQEAKYQVHYLTRLSQWQIANVSRLLPSELEFKDEAILFPTRESEEFHFEPHPSRLLALSPGASITHQSSGYHCQELRSLSMFQRRVIASANVVERVASNRQIRRKTRHPANLRALQRQPQEEVVVPPLKFEPTYVPEKVSFNGWSPAPEAPLPGLPFHVKRTAVGLQLPVYRDFRNGRTRVLTILRRYKGDEQELRDEMSKVCQGKEVIVRPGRLEVVGDHASDIRKWLVGLGF
ncbi:hypothetical protein PC116_g11135 [Phytophthora cactorum]|uniref:Large ribosomal subunit protein mL49 n=2 Tax=Phytophthora cactorum TaxID=29920 RepID=A0A8T0Z5G8_9STRA|nr:hypothetical protein PC111_g8955 [Phytophthora cactorum]KAG2830174.1 hypothetical protein PC112_g7793 [Phytophthora cactorum]KAG2857591.1 hypothetical protein PC113_g10557 [Phytophthora cactorum]KAG2939707.1 hypothetical protein PC117_g10828 [Phytophthora cactorum]KAG3018583.1 hypothetical protein PC119_g10604 [Phytophthora cactorum]